MGLLSKMLNCGLLPKLAIKHHLSDQGIAEESKALICQLWRFGMGN